MKTKPIVWRYGAAFLIGLAVSLCPPSSWAIDGAPNAPVKTKPVPLDWRAAKWTTLDYDRASIPGGGSLYTLHGQGEKKVRLNLVFSSGVFDFSPKQATSVRAAAELRILGGAGRRSYDELDNYASEHGIDMVSGMNNVGDFSIQLTSLTQDFPRALEIVHDVLFAPRFEKEALDLWKQEQNDAFASLLDAGTNEKQMRFMAREANKIALGEDHYLTQTLRRMSPTEINAVKLDEIKQISEAMLNRANLDVLISGGFSDADVKRVQELVIKIPRKSPSVRTWLPGRTVAKPEDRMKVVVITKPDMKQCMVDMRLFVPNVGELNPLERTQMKLAQEVLSSSGGVVGNDRWSKAMRAESGFSYSASGQFIRNIVQPNTDVGMWRLVFQSPNDRIDEAALLAKKTWDTYATKGISQEELDNARVARMNALMSTEETIFDKADDFLSDLAEDVVPPSLWAEHMLAKFDRQRDAQAVNATLQRTAHSGLISVMVIMGNPSKEKLEKLASSSGFEIVKTVPFSSLAEEFKH